MFILFIELIKLLITKDETEKNKLLYPVTAEIGKGVRGSPPI